MFNNYGNYGNTYTPYAPNYQMYQPQKPIQQQDVPFIIVRFGTLDEAKAHIVPPSKAVMFIKSDFTELYVKSADTMGNPMLETIKCTKTDNYTSETQTPEFDTKDFVKQDDIKDFVTTEQLKNLLDEKLGTIETDVKKLNRLNDLLKGGKDGE